MKLEVGMFLRTNDGKIAKFIKYDEKDKNELVTDYYEYSTIWIKDIIKASFNIIDLIEVGDYVNGREVVEEPCNDNFSVGQKHLWLCNKKLYLLEQDIESIVTKEQFEQVSYKVNN